MGTIRRVTDAQVKELRKWLQQKASLSKAALKAGMDRKSARKYRAMGKLPSEAREPRDWRTREDPLATVWPELEEKLRREPELQAVTLLGWLQSAYPEKYPASVRRTLERRVRRWKAEHGPAKEIYFAQVHEPGRLAASDFTHMNSLGVTIAGERFDHLLYHFVLTYSNWESALVCFAETFANLSVGMQNAFWELGGVTEGHRTDRMTLAVNADGQPEQFTVRYQGLLEHYGVRGEATNPASGHENGDCEQSHRRFKEAVGQALLLRGSRDFGSRAEYERFLRELVQRRNAGRASALAEELAALRRLPARRLEAQERRRVRVRKGSTIEISRNTYSVPPRLIGEYVEARIGVEEIEVWYAEGLVQRMPRLRGQHKHHIDYRHIIGWLVRKPGAFARYVFREELYPTTTFRRAYDALTQQDRSRADKDYVQILYLAAQEGESLVEAALARLLGASAGLSVRAVRELLGRESHVGTIPDVKVPPVDLGQYDTLLTAAAFLTDQEGPAVVRGEEEVKHDAEPGRRSDTLSDGAAPADDARPVRCGVAASDGGDMGVCGLPAGTGPTGVPATTRESDRACAERIEAAPGEELGGTRSEASAGEGRAAVAWAAERGLPGSPRERARVRSAGLWENTLSGCGGPGAGKVGPARVVHDVRSAGSGTAGGQAGLHAQGTAETPGPLGGGDPGRSGLRAAEPGGDGSAVHVPGRAVRAWERAADKQPGVLEVGTDLQGPDDDGGRGGSFGASQRDRGIEHSELPSRGGQANEASRGIEEGAALGRAGSAPVALAALGLPTLRQPAPTRGNVNYPAPVQSAGVRQAIAGNDNCR
jgi:transposase